MKDLQDELHKLQGMEEVAAPTFGQMPKLIKVPVSQLAKKERAAWRSWAPEANWLLQRCRDCRTVLQGPIKLLMVTLAVISSCRRFH